MHVEHVIISKCIPSQSQENEEFPENQKKIELSHDQCSESNFIKMITIVGSTDMNMLTHKHKAAAR